MRIRIRYNESTDIFKSFVLMIVFENTEQVSLDL